MTTYEYTEEGLHALKANLFPIEEVAEEIAEPVAPDLSQANYVPSEGSTRGGHPTADSASAFVRDLFNRPE